MTARIIDGKAFAAKLRERIAAEAARLKAAHGLVPGLATVLVGEDPASEVYVRNKNRAAEALGYHSVSFHLPGDASEAEVLARGGGGCWRGGGPSMPIPKSTASWCRCRCRAKCARRRCSTCSSLRRTSTR